MKLHRWNSQDDSSWSIGYGEVMATLAIIAILVVPNMTYLPLAERLQSLEDEKIEELERIVELREQAELEVKLVHAAKQNLQEKWKLKKQELKQKEQKLDGQLAEGRKQIEAQRKTMQEQVTRAAKQEVDQHMQQLRRQFTGVNAGTLETYWVEYVNKSPPPSNIVCFPDGVYVALKGMPVEGPLDPTASSTKRKLRKLFRKLAYGKDFKGRRAVNVVVTNGANDTYIKVRDLYEAVIRGKEKHSKLKLWTSHLGSDEKINKFLRGKKLPGK